VPPPQGTSGAISTEFLHFPARVLVIQAARRGYERAALLPDPILPVYSGVRAVRFSSAVASSRTGPRVPVGGPRSAVGDQAAAWIAEHVPQAADRLASTRARRAAAARDVRSAGTASPVPKYISSGVCPRNAEWGSTRLCSWT
jgi:hypothetical protein